MFRSVIDAGQAAIKSAFLVNGGGAVAMLAYVSRLGDQNPTAVPTFAESLLWFTIGVFLAAALSGLTYFSQFFYASYRKTPRTIGTGFHVLAVISGLASYAAFIKGMDIAYISFAGVA